MNCISKFALTPLALALSFPAFAEKNWGGSFFGASINQGTSSNNSDSSYLNNGASPSTGWNQNQFKGDLLNSINTMQMSGSFDLPTTSSTSNLPQWGSGGGNKNQSITSGTLLAGKNVQIDNIVLGGEFRISFGNFNSSSSQVNSGTASNSITDYEGPISLTFTNYNSSLSGITSPVNIGFNQPRLNTVNYTQTGSQQNSAKYNNLSQLIARAGYSFGDIMIYGLGGVAYANVKATTSTSISETATGTLSYGSTTLNYTGSASYTFSGQSTKNMFGPSLGLGAEWAIQDDTTFRLEGAYYNLGKINVQSVSAQTAATYSVSQSISAYNLSIGLIRKF
jgi:opacity protein-like surface antigen